MNYKQKMEKNRHTCENCFYYESLFDKCKIGEQNKNMNQCKGNCKKWVHEK